MTMGRLFVLMGIIVATACGFLLLVDVNVAGESALRVADMPALCLGTRDSAPCWLTVGGGYGVLVVGLGGVGIVCLTLYGAGLLFATGQAAAGGIAFGQVGVGISLFLGQVGGAFSAFGQVVGGAVADGQAALGIRGRLFLETLSEDLREHLRL